MLRGFQSYKDLVNPVLVQLLELTGMDARFVRASGCSLWDDRGQEFLDFFSGSGTFNLGHNSPAVIEAVTEALGQELPWIYGIAASPHMGELAEALTVLAGPTFNHVFLSNSGTEAVEGSLKLARACTRRPTIVYCENAYHGTTLGSLSLMESGPFREPFEPLLRNCVKIPFNNLEALGEALNANECAAFVVEPIQAEGGIRLPEDGFLKHAAELCQSAGTLLVLDEIQTGMGRTGSLFSFQSGGVIPDIFTLAKALGGGMMPIGAYVTRRELYDRAYGTYSRCESHHSTFGGNTLSCRAALAAIDGLSAPELLAHVDEEGAYLLDCLRQSVGGSPLVKAIRGRGLLIGIEFAAVDHPQLQWDNLDVPDFAGRNMVAQLIMKRLFDQRILTQTCVHAWQVLKLEPPLVVTRAQVERCVTAIVDAVRWLESIV
ncbi:MAG: aspartate aminotransferase family protein [Actinomycetota bacterium]|nr:aspartate aminotransferase family protein [Actinomycetota bacterium]